MTLTEEEKAQTREVILKEVFRRFLVEGKAYVFTNEIIASYKRHDGIKYGENIDD